MELNELKELKTYIDQIEKEDLSFLIREKDGTNLIQRLTSSEIINIIQESITAIKEAENLNILYSCSAYYFRRENQNIISIILTLQNLHKVIVNKNLTGIESWTLSLQTFILQSGIYSILVKNEKPEVLSELKKLRTENKSLNKELRENFTKAKEIKESLNILKTEIETFKSAKEKELTQITNNLTSTNQTKLQIEQTNNSILKVKSSIDKSIAEVQNSINNFQKQIENHNLKVTEIETRILDEEKKAKKISETNTIESENLKSLSEQATIIQKQLEKLLTPAIARDLQSTFRIRKKWLFWSTIIWLIITLLITSFLAWYIYNLFGNEEFSFELEKVLVAGIRLIPIVTLLYFAIRQFTKTRSLEEEYAFRESIATSLMAYAEQITGDTNRKDQLIQETVNKLYESPTTSKILQSKDTSKSDSYLKELIELIKELKSV